MKSLYQFGIELQKSLNIQELKRSYRYYTNEHEIDSSVDSVIDLECDEYDNQVKDIEYESEENQDVGNADVEEECKSFYFEPGSPTREEDYQDAIQALDSVIEGVERDDLVSSYMFYDPDAIRKCYSIESLYEEFDV